MRDGVEGERFSVGAREDRLVWILGSSRSGNTWLLRMLAELPGAVPIDDPHLGHHLGVWRPIPLAWAAAAGEPTLTTLDEVKRESESYFFSERYRDAWEPALRELVVARFDAQVAAKAAEGPGDAEPLVIVKEPGSHVAGLLLELFPRSRLIFLIRDGRDVVDSWMDAHRPGSWALDEGAFTVAPEGREALVRWLSAVWAYRMEAVERAYRVHPPSRRASVRYEDLLADPVGELERICAHLKLAASGSQLERIARAHEYERVPAGERGALKEIRAAAPGGWRRNLGPSEQRAMHEVMGRKLAELGYLGAPASRAA